MMLFLFALILLLAIPLLILNGWAAAVVAGWFVPELGLSTVEGIGVALILSILHPTAAENVHNAYEVIVMMLSRALSTFITLGVAAAVYGLVAS